MKKKRKFNPTILAIETSCDDTSIAILKNNKIIFNKTITCYDTYKKYQGIIPELAARSHADNLNCLLNDVLNTAKINIKEIDYIAYTNKPGLIGCLNVGKIFAKTLSYLFNKPLIPIDHMIAHAFSFCINKNNILQYPFLALDVSGGHTIIYLFKSKNEYIIVNQTTDDAIGEALDKIGNELGLPYPGGISLDKIFNKLKTNLPFIKHNHPTNDFSFSGVKTYAKNLINKNEDKIAIGSSFLKWCVDELINKIKWYEKCYDVKFVSIGGGVAANTYLRSQINKLKSKVYLVDKKYCGDNAAMIANLANLIA